VVERVTGPLARLQVSATPSSRTLGRGDVVVAGLALETDDHTRAALRLTGGASVRLDRNTRLTFDSAARVSLVSGALYVDSPPGAKGSPIEVRTPRGLMRELGTQFEVRVLEPEVRVRVREGAVRVETSGPPQDARRGDEVRTNGHDLTRASVALSGAPWDWVLDVAPPFALEGRTLADFLSWACRENGWTLQYVDDAATHAAGEVVLHGSVQMLTPTQAVEAVLPTVGFAHRVEGGTLVIARAAR
jgi:ferric-dicitrate binding protein FerR (iron transport regulator)